jgi:hypothetical protein
MQIYYGVAERTAMSWRTDLRPTQDTPIGLTQSEDYLIKQIWVLELPSRLGSYLFRNLFA